jgi:hypothetical protein
MRDEPTRRPDSGERSTVFGTRGTVACKHPHAALAGIQALDDGGNIADPIVQLRVGTVEYLEASSRLATRTRQPLTHRVCCYSEHRDRRPYPAKIPALRALARLVLPFYGQRRLVGTVILTSPCTRDKHFLFVGLRFPDQLALDDGLVEANEALAAYLMTGTPVWPDCFWIVRAADASRSTFIDLYSYYSTVQHPVGR